MTLFQVPQLRTIDLDVLDQIGLVRERLGANLRTPARWHGLLRRSTLGHAIRGSNSIEGYRVAKEESVAAAAGGEISDATQETYNAIAGYRMALTYVLRLASDRHFAFSEGLVRSLHFMMLQHDLSKNPGQWRPGPIFVHDEEKGERVYEGPDESLVPRLIEELLSEMSADSGTQNLVRAAMAHLNFVMIHPFRDGNGRMGRCLQTMVLARSGMPEPVFSSIEEYLGANQRPYYDVLAAVGQGQWNPGNDAHPWVRFCIRAHFFQANTALRRTREMARLYDSVETEVRRRHLPERMELALIDAANGFRVRNSTYRDGAAIPKQLASNDLSALVRAGLLVGNGAKRGRFYTAAEVLLEMKAKAREKGSIVDPFIGEPARSSETRAARGAFTIQAGVSATGPQPHPLKSPSDAPK